MVYDRRVYRLTEGKKWTRTMEEALITRHDLTIAATNFRVLATVSGALYNTVDNKCGEQKDCGTTINIQNVGRFVA